MKGIVKFVTVACDFCVTFTSMIFQNTLDIIVETCAHNIKIQQLWIIKMGVSTFVCIWQDGARTIQNKINNIIPSLLSINIYKQACKNYFWRWCSLAAIHLKNKKVLNAPINRACSVICIALDTLDLVSEDKRTDLANTFTNHFKAINKKWTVLNKLQITSFPSHYKSNLYQSE